MSRWLLRSGVTVAVAGLVSLGAAVVMPTSGNGLAELVGAATTATTPPQVLPPAPATFSGQLTTVYDDVYKTDQLVDAKNSSLGVTSQLPSPTQFATSVNGLSGEEQSELYAATQKNPQWSTLPLQYQKLIGQLGGAASTGTATSNAMAVTQAMVRPIVGGAEQHPARLTAGAPFPPSEPTGAFPSPPSPYQPSSPVAPYTTASCPTGAPGGPSDAPGTSAIYAVTLTDTIAANIAADVPTSITLIIAGEGTTIPDPAKFIAEAIQLAATVTLDTFNYLQAVAATCAATNVANVTANIDNTTVNIYNLLSAMETTLDDVENSVDTVGQQVNVAQQTIDDELTLAIEQALIAPAGSPPNAAYELPASLGGNLNSTPIGVQEVVTEVLTEAKQAGLPVNATATGDLAGANADLSAGDDAGAYAAYAAAYQAAAS